ncbi:MAG TPA: hypothetical protein VL135_14885 [Terracidiphilus sp.]|nr:hypothetical protein [Terracidiphilus sp.]
MNRSPGELELLSERVDDLERRVLALEHPAEIKAAQVDEHEQEVLIASGSALETFSIFPIIGRSMLGVAGAYLLRAVAESGVLPRLPVSVFAVAYAFAWLVWSSRISSSLPRVMYAGTAALILTPMLWESTLTFHVFTPVVTAGVLAAFLTLATVLDLRNGKARGMWIAQGIGVLTTAALGFRTHEVLPFVTAILLALCVTEFARSREYQEPVWPLIVVAADISVWGLIFIYSGAQDTRMAYPLLSTAALIAPASILFAINGAAISAWVVRRKRGITIFEVIQVTIAFALVVTAVFYFAPEHGAMILGIVSLVLSGGTYACASLYLRAGEERRSFRVFAVWSAALLVAGSLWALPLQVAAILLAVAAGLATYLSRRFESSMHEFHAVVFLTGASVVADLPRYLYGCLAGTPPRSPGAAILIVSLCAMAALFLARSEADNAWQRFLHLVMTFIAICAVTALLAQAVLSGTRALIALDAHHVAFLRTLSVCAVALAIGFVGSRWGRRELTHLAYAALALLAVKLLFEDLRHGQMGFAAASIALFAVTLMGVPRLVRLGAQRHAKAELKAECGQVPHVPV